MLPPITVPPAVERQLLNLSSDAIIVCAFDDNRIEFWSDGAEAMYGYSAEEALGHTTFELIRTEFPTSPAEIKAELRAQHVWAGELVHRTKDGCEVRVASRWYWHDGGSKQFFFEINRDVSARRRTEVALDQCNRDVGQMLRTRERFIAAISHELRTPLNAILGFSDLLLENGQGEWSEKQHRFVEHIHSGGRHILTLVDEMLDLARIDAGKLTPRPMRLQLAAAVQTTVYDMELPAQQKQIALTQQVAPELWVRADAARLRQILGNLLSNAVKFTPAQGQVWIDASPKDGSIELVVGDTGIGIEAGEQENAFQEFWRSNQAGPQSGAGLGLAITRRLVEAHGGSIRLESEAGHGSRFFVMFPAA
ncbi:MAG: PAS domain-containing sensor histidine kinase [Acidobacteria bacterium]|nr:MAG: PAS domain-containing sensor histidine kinase [Acidobacteriota bacterium]